MIVMDVVQVWECVKTKPFAWQINVEIHVYMISKNVDMEVQEQNVLLVMEDFLNPNPVEWIVWIGLDVK